MEKIVQDYRKLITDLPAKIKKSSFKPKAYIKMLEIPSATFYNRMKLRNFTIEETEKIVRILKMEAELEKCLSAGMNDAANGNIIHGEKVFKNLEEQL